MPENSTSLGTFAHVCRQELWQHIYTWQLLQAFERLPDEEPIQNRHRRPDTCLVRVQQAPDDGKEGCLKHYSQLGGGCFCCVAVVAARCLDSVCVLFSDELKNIVVDLRREPVRR